MTYNGYKDQDAFHSAMRERWEEMRAANIAAQLTDNRTAITISHSYAAGTLLEGTSRGDGTAEIVKAHGWRWGRSIGSWYVPNSRDRLSKGYTIEQTAKALQAAGFDVTVEIDDTPVSAAETEAAKAERAEARADGLALKADRRRSDADAAWQRDQQLSDMLPPGGEPIHVGHHSEGRHRRAIARSWDALGKAVHAEDEAKEAARRAEIAAQATDARNRPVTVANRIDKLQAEARGIRRSIEGEPAWTDETPSRLYLKKPSGAYLDRLNLRLAELEDQISYWQDVRAAQQATGVATDYGRHNVTKGDLVKIRGSWREVVRANAKTVSTPSGYGWNDTAPWHEVQAHRAHAKDAAAV